MKISKNNSSFKRDNGDSSLRNAKYYKIENALRSCWKEIYCVKIGTSIFPLASNRLVEIFQISASPFSIRSISKIAKLDEVVAWNGDLLRLLQQRSK